LIITDQSIAFPSERLVSSFFISASNSFDHRISHNFTIVGFGFGSWIPTQSVPGIGATILSDLHLSDNAISFVSHSIVAILIPDSGLILICTIDGPISNPSMMIGTLNSNNLFCNDLAFSIKKDSSIETHDEALFSIVVHTLKVGFSPEKLIIGLSFLSLSFSCIFSSSLFLRRLLINEREID
jgi:hypothetical protein